MEYFIHVQLTTMLRASTCSWVICQQFTTRDGMEDGQDSSELWLLVSVSLYSIRLFRFSVSNLAGFFYLAHRTKKHSLLGMLMRLKNLESRYFFSIPGKGISLLPRIETSDRPTIGGIIATCRSALAISQLLVCFTAAVARIPDARTPRNKGQWRI